MMHSFFFCENREIFRGRKSWPGRSHARAIFEKVKICFVNFLLIIFGHSCACRGDPFVIHGCARAGDLPGVHTGVSYDHASCELGPVHELRAGPAAGPVLSIHKRAAAATPASLSHIQQLQAALLVHNLFTIYLHFKT